MASNHALDTTDRLLKEVMKNDYPFGGKVLLLGGDFRQCLSVLPHAPQAAIIQNSIKFAKSWDLFKKLPLTMNMRSNSDPEYSEWLLKLGNGTLSDDNGLSEGVVEIPLSMICKGSLVDWVFGKKIQPGNISEFSERAILCPKNSDVDKLNDDVLNIVEGNDKTYLSVDSVVADNRESANNFPTEFLNSLSPSGMPPHKLRLKIGAIIMLLRNLNTRRGLCNGTRLEVLELKNTVIIAKSLTGSSKDEIHVIPRIDLAPSQTGLPFQLRRRQFPVKLAFAMTINKSQGQTLKRVGIFLPEPAFAHGQLYVACSRVRERTDVKLKIIDGPLQGELKNDGKIYTRNVVYKEIFDM